MRRRFLFFRGSEIVNVLDAARKATAYPDNGNGFPAVCRMTRLIRLTR